ncbi:hypothetical protein HaLaN_30825, partial [Haematococcus lacustris]
MRRDMSFNLTTRSQSAVELADELRNEEEADEEDLRVAAALAALFTAWEGNSGNVLRWAGALAQATHVILQRRNRMLERHVLPDVVEDMRYKAVVDVGELYKSAWIDGKHHELHNNHPELLDACLARAVADTSICDAKWRLQLRLAMANSPPSTSVVKQVTGEVWAAGNGRLRVPYCTILAPQQPSFEAVWDAMVAAKE